MSNASSIQAHFSSLKDPRINRQKQHDLMEMLIIAICAALCGIDDM